MTGESVEQAALRRATEPDWQGRARREAAALLDGFGEDREIVVYLPRAALIDMLAVAWLQGVNLGCHETLTRAEGAFDKMRAAL